jgi:hypothetical protein
MVQLIEQCSYSKRKRKKEKEKGGSQTWANCCQVIDMEYGVLSVSQRVAS